MSPEPFPLELAQAVVAVTIFAEISATMGCTSLAVALEGRLPA